MFKIWQWNVMLWKTPTLKIARSSSRNSVFIGCYHIQISLTMSQQTQSDIFIQTCYKMHCGVRLHGQNACYVIFWNIASKHWIYMDTGISTLYMYSNWNYQNLRGKMCRIEKNPIMISPYSIFEVDKLPHDKFFSNS
jgi:hypothetical protein